MIDLAQTRVDVEAQLNDPFAGFESLNLRVGLNDYQHQEIEASGEVATVFDNQAWEARLLAQHHTIAGFDGSLGVQLSDRDFKALGEEAFVPPVTSKTTGIFWVAERPLGAASLELGARAEQVEHTPDSSAPVRDYDVLSASLGLVVAQTDQLSWSFLVDYSERAPSIEELYSFGPHFATQSFEIGHIDLDIESGLNFTLSGNYESDLFDARATLYRTDFNHYIYQAETGEQEDGLPVRVYNQSDVRFVGLDLEIGFHLAEIAGGDLDLTGMFDSVEAELTGSLTGYLPRIPADRFGAGLVWHNDTIKASVNFQDVAMQNKVSQSELPTQGYTDLSASLSYRFTVSDTEIVLFVNGRNLQDREQRYHTSFVKDIAPAPGRTIEAGLRFQF